MKQTADRIPLLPLLVLLVGATASITPARGEELWASEDEETVLQGSGFLKTQTIGFRFPDQALFPEGMRDERAGRHSATGRLGAHLDWGDIELGAEYQLTATVLSPGLAEQQGAVPGFATTVQTRPRLWDFDADASAGVELMHNLDRYYVQVPLGPLDLTVGRQAITWGSAWFWSPTDRFSPFSPMDVDPDVKRGVDAVRAQVYFGRHTSLDLVAAFERHPDADREWWVNGGMRFRTHLLETDLALSAARFQQSAEGDWMLGAEFSGQLGKVGFRGEACVNYLDGAGSWDVEAVLGWDYHFPIGLTLAGELFFNGYGTDDTDEYIEYFFDPADPLNPEPAKGERLRRGEAFNIGRYYAAITADQEIHPLLHLTFSAIGNLGDPSVLMTAGLQWSVRQDVRVTAGAMVPVGESPDGLLLASEYGVYPIVGYGVVKVSF